MKKLMIFCTALTFAFTLRSHDVRMAHYVVYVEEEKVVCDARIDSEDLQKVLKSDFDQQQVSQFILDHLTFYFDGKEVDIEVVNYYKTDDWVEIRLALQTVNRHPKEVEVFNGILSEQVARHDNLMRFILHERTRIFRLNKDRQQISFSYKKS